MNVGNAKGHNMIQERRPRKSDLIWGENGKIKTAGHRPKEEPRKACNRRERRRDFIVP